jgi:hypothetical protein
MPSPVALEDIVGWIILNKEDITNIGCFLVGLVTGDDWQEYDHGDNSHIKMTRDDWQNNHALEEQNKMIIMGHQISSCHVLVVRSFFILKKMLLPS